ncbi:MAG: UDP-N-acetylglucosamine 2-epimerase (non-hydrolyzing) [Alphaproteobacteria bacterium]|nr:UDP-N-acetylglucosamine 2-epimerase (non-hydrolyzing) [Alphaproteobacteria bacterium]
MLKVMTVVGTRPEIIRLSRIIPALDRHFSHVLVHTGQNHDPNLKDIFFRELNLRAPDYYFELATSTVGAMLSGLFLEMEKALIREQPDALLILGDTNSALSCIIARKYGVPVYHMEAGNRCFDPDSPEEANRRIVDHTSDFNLPYTEAARRNLLREGLHPRRIYVTGSPVYEVVQHYQSSLHDNDVVHRLGLRRKEYFAASIHPQETVDDGDNIRDIFAALDALHQKHGWPVVVSTHPRTKAKIEQFRVVKSGGIRLMPPFGYFDWCRLQMSAACVVSDSGTVSEEAAILNFPAVTPRNAMERPEAMENGNVVLCGLSPETIAQSVALMMARPAGGAHEIPEAYRVPDVSHRVAAPITGTCKLAQAWNH